MTTAPPPDPARTWSVPWKNSQTIHGGFVGLACCCGARRITSMRTSSPKSR